MSPDVLRHFERLAAERLFAIARHMTAQGLEGCDPDDPHIAGLLMTADHKGLTGQARVDWLRARRP